MTSKHSQKPVKVLHIGNVANNAYLNSKILRSAGYASDVICYDYYHLMGCPEWEDSQLPEYDGKEFDFPLFEESKLGEFQRPRWFVQGPTGDCLHYLLARHEQDVATQDRLWALIEESRKNACSVGRSTNWIRKHPTLHYIARKLKHSIRFLCELTKKNSGRTASTGNSAVWGYIRSINQHHAMWRKIVSLYDVIIGYATDGYIPLYFGPKPYIAYEHGTIRSLPFEETAAGQLCAETYQKADGVVITNCDNIEAARRLGCARYKFIPHPINEVDVQEHNVALLRKSLRDELKAEFIVFHPSRQHWDKNRDPNWEKGNDIFFSGLARLIAKESLNVAVVAVAWGAKLHATKQLLSDLGIASRVKWVNPLPNRLMTEYIKATDALADQFYLGAFGSTFPKALRCGRVGLLHIDENVHIQCFHELPPAINCRTSEDVCNGLNRLFRNKDWRLHMQENGQSWYNSHHSAKLIGQRLASLVDEVNEKRK